MKRDLVIEGKFVRLEEVQPKHFPYIIEWRNNPENNRFLNQPFKLTLELQTKWYEEKYLNDDTQGLFVMVDKKTGTPFGTLGWTDFDNKKRICIPGRSLLGNKEYHGTIQMFESHLLMNDFRYYTLRTDINFAHIVDENRIACAFSKRWGFVKNEGKIMFPQELFVNGMRQTEYVRTREQYELAKERLLKFFEGIF